jgi:endonuclease YncB( thermonuclease family)
VTTWSYPATVLRVVDGDTIRLHLDLGLHIWRIENVRIANINTPELSTTAGRAAKRYTEQLLSAGTPVTFVSKTLDKYGRPLGTITLPDGTDYGAAMLAAGHAVPYEG